jgi:ribosome biogenesis GTPase
MLLEQLGWNSYFAAMWADLAREAGWLPARVIQQARGLWRIAGAFSHEDSVEVWVAASGKLREQGSTGGNWPAVGDWVAAEIADGELRGVVHAVLPRRSQFVRKTAGKQIEQQVLAANVDTAFLVASLDGDFNLRRIERYLAQCWESGASPAILLNKVDQLVKKADSTGSGVSEDTGSNNSRANIDVVARVAEVERVAQGVPVLPLSGRTGQGIEALEPFLGTGQTVVLLGSSGVGKSTLVNRLLGCDVQATQPVRDSDSRGRHTTTSRELLRLPGGAMIIDTPGLRELQLWDAAEGISEAFADIGDLAAQCRFRDCRHENEPGCAVMAAIASGALDEARLNNRRKLEREQEFLRRKMDPNARHESQQKLRVMMRGVKKMYEQREKDRGKP